MTTYQLQTVVWQLLSSRHFTWWHHQMETFSTLLALCPGNSPVTGEFPSQRPVTQSFDVFLDLRLNKWLSKQSTHRQFDMPSRSLWLHCNDPSLFWPQWLHHHKWYFRTISWNGYIGMLCLSICPCMIPCVHSESTVLDGFFPYLVQTITSVRGYITQNDYEPWPMYLV